MRAAFAGSPEGALRDLTCDDPSGRPYRPYHRPAVPGLGFNEPGDAACNVLDVAAGDGSSEGLTQTGDVTGDSDSIGTVNTGSGGGARPGDGECVVLEDLIDPTPYAKGVRLDRKVGLDRSLPGGLAAGAHAPVEEFPGLRGSVGEDAEDLVPYPLRIEQLSKMR